MNENLLKMLSIQKDIEKNSKKQTVIKSIAFLCVIIVFFSGFGEKMIESIIFVATILVLIVLFVLDSNFANSNHSLEVEIYLLELGHLKSEKKAEAEDGKAVSENWIDSISKPADKAPLPIVYYFVLLMIEAVIFIF